MGDTTMVSYFPEVINLPTYIFFFYTNIVSTSSLLFQPSAPPQNFPGCREIIRRAFCKKGIPECGIPTLLKSLSQSTLKQYNTVFKTWWQFCLTEKVDYLEAGIAEVITFLQKLYDTKPLSHSSFNMYRSAISLILPGNIGQDQRITRFIKGIARLRPAKRRYDFIWDPQVVLNLLDTWYPNEDLSLEKLTKKLTVLLALITAHRIQTLVLIKVENIIISPSLIQIFIQDEVKTSLRHNNLQPCLKIPFFPEKPRICLAAVLLEYLKVTSSFRTTGQEYLLLTTRKPYNTASTDSVSRWIRSTLAEAGVDTGIFSAYSTRHAATSAAFRNGIMLETIRKTAGWSQTSETFARFYNKPLKDYSVFASSIYGTTKQN